MLIFPLFVVAQTDSSAEPGEEGNVTPLGGGGASSGSALVSSPL